MARMTLTEANKIADDCQIGNGHLYTDAELTKAEFVLWSASRVDYNRLDAIAAWKGTAAVNEYRELRTRNGGKK